MSKGKISVVIKTTVPPANDKLSQQWQKKVENSITTRLLVPRYLLLVQHIQLLSQSNVQSINEPSFFFHFISRPCLLASRRAMIDYSFLATYVGTCICVSLGKVPTGIPTS